MAREVMFEALTEGPYRAEGRYIVHRRGDRFLSGPGFDGRPAWRRRPYYGHVMRDGSRWRAMQPGGSGWIPTTFRTRGEAGAYLVSLGKRA